MIILLGTSHISPESLKTIKNTVEKEKPDCVAVELDAMRYAALVSKQGTRPPGIFLKLLSWVQKELGKMTGIYPGEEMIQAIKISKKNKIPVYLIDQNFSITVRDIQKMNPVEKIKLFGVALFGSFTTKKFDLSKVPPEKLIKEALLYLKKHFPEMYRIIVVKRNIHMSAAVKVLLKRHEKILVVVGAGHIEGMKKLLKNEEIKIIG